MNSDIRILEVETFLVGTRCRTPLKFGAVVVDELPIGYARVTVENRRGAVASGWGAMFLMDLWAWPQARAPAPMLALASPERQRPSPRGHRQPLR